MREFQDIGSFMLHLAAMQIAVQHEAEKGLGKAIKIITAAAKAELGHYLEQVGPFPAWAPLAESTLKYHESMGVGESPLLVTGGLYASIKDEHQGNEAVSGTESDIGAYQEFGTRKIPPRPFMGPAAITSQERIEAVMGAAGVKGMLYGTGSSMLPL